MIGAGQVAIKLGLSEFGSDGQPLREAPWEAISQPVFNPPKAVKYIGQPYFEAPLGALVSLPRSGL